MAYWIVGRRRTRADAPRPVTWMQMGRILKLPHKAGRDRVRIPASSAI